MAPALAQAIGAHLEHTQQLAPTLASVNHTVPPIAADPGAPSPASAEELAALLRKEQLNAYGIMAPPCADGQRRAARGSGLFHACAMVNHECNPNTARFDLFDVQPVQQPASKTFTLRAMHDLPPGERYKSAFHISSLRSAESCCVARLRGYPDLLPADLVVRGQATALPGGLRIRLQLPQVPGEVTPCSFLHVLLFTHPISLRFRRRLNAWRNSGVVMRKI